MTERLSDLEAALAPTRPTGDLRGMKAVLLCGGRGTRLAPFTSVLPKPLMPIGERSILEIVVRRLATSGITDVTLCVGYLSHLIRAVFDNGPGKGLDITYVNEKTPLGTAAPLRNVPRLESTFIVMNGDVLTTLDFHDLVDQHRRDGNALTIATHRRTLKIDYGVLRHERAGDRDRLVGFDEKPEIPLTVSMGIYVMEPELLGLIPREERYDFPDLARAAVAEGLAVGVYLYDGIWFDIGRHDDYEEAVAAWEQTDSPLRRELEPRPRDERQASQDSATNRAARSASPSSV
jgi:NDP-sugar pyrophosphorylase family protein